MKLLTHFTGTEDTIEVEIDGKDYSIYIEYTKTYGNLKLDRVDALVFDEKAEEYTPTKLSEEQKHELETLLTDYIDWSEFEIESDWMDENGGCY